MSILLMDQVVEQLNHKGCSGRIYPVDVIEESIKNIKEGRTLYGEFGSPKQHPGETFDNFYRRWLTVNLDQVCIKASDLRIVDDKVLANIEILDTSMGTVLQKVIEDGISIAFKLRHVLDVVSTGLVNKSIIVTVDVIASPLEGKP